MPRCLGAENLGDFAGNTLKANLPGARVVIASLPNAILSWKIIGGYGSGGSYISATNSKYKLETVKKWGSWCLWKVIFLGCQRFTLDHEYDNLCVIKPPATIVLGNDSSNSDLE